MTHSETWQFWKFVVLNLSLELDMFLLPLIYGLFLTTY